MLMDDVSKVVEIEGCDLHNMLEEDSSICRHLNFEERHHHHELLGVDHCPKLIETGRDQDVDHEV